MLKHHLFHCVIWNQYSPTFSIVAIIEYAHVQLFDFSLCTRIFRKKKKSFWSIDNDGYLVAPCVNPLASCRSSL